MYILLAQIWDLHSYHASVVRGWIYNPFELALCRTGQDFLGHQDFKNHGLIKKGKIRSPIHTFFSVCSGKTTENINILPNSTYNFCFYTKTKSMLQIETYLGMLKTLCMNV